MANLSKTTRDHEEIQRWAQERGAHPACVKGTGDSGDIGILRLDFPGYGGEESLQEITWEEFFEKFDERGLSLLYQEETAGGERSNFNKLVSAETAAEAEEPSHGRKRSSTRVAKKVASPGRGTAAKKGAGKAATKKAAAKKAVSGKKAAATKKTTAKKTVAKKALAKKKALKKAATKKGPAKKSAVKKAIKKTASKKAVKKAAGRRR